MKNFFKKNKKITEISNLPKTWNLPRQDTIGQSIDKILKTLSHHTKEDRALILDTISLHIKNMIKKNKESFKAFTNLNLGTPYNAEELKTEKDNSCPTNGI